MDTISTLLTHEQYFGLDAWTLRDGVKRLLAGAGTGRTQPAIVLADIAKAFCLDDPASQALLDQWLAHRLVRSEGTRYRITRGLREYAVARIVEPLDRARARRLLREVRELARTINAQWRRNALVVDTIAVSGSYMSRRRKLGKLYVWLVVHPRPTADPARRRRVTGISEGAREILDAIGNVSSYVVPRVVADRRRIERPFSIVFHAEEDGPPSTASAAWWRPTEWVTTPGRTVAQLCARALLRPLSRGRATASRETPRTRARSPR